MGSAAWGQSVGGCAMGEAAVGLDEEEIAEFP